MVKIGGSKKRKLGKKRKLNENRGKFTNFEKVGRELVNFVEIGGNLQCASLA